MANSVVVHFAAAKWGDLGRWLDEAAAPVAPRRWKAPAEGEPLLSIFEYDDALLAYQPQTVDRLLDRLPVGPKSSVCLQFAAGRRADAVEAAAEFARLLLHRFSGVAHDGAGRFWSLSEIEAAEEAAESAPEVRGPAAARGRFLDALRGEAAG